MSNIDELYKDSNNEGSKKSEFYLGIVSQVSRGICNVQVENLSVLHSRKIGMESLIPSTINFHVLINSSCGVILGEVYQSQIKNSKSVHDAMNTNQKESVFPELSIDVLGVMNHTDNYFSLPDFKNPGIGDKVYIANRETEYIYTKSLEVNRDEYAKKESKKLSNFAKLRLTGTSLDMYPNTLFDRHLLVIGSTNSGKSTSSLSILNELIKTNRKVLIIDPTGEYEDTFSDEEVNKFHLGIDTCLSPKQISLIQWNKLFETNDGSQGGVLYSAILSLRYQTKISKSEKLYIKVGKTPEKISEDMAEVNDKYKDFCLKNLPEQIRNESVAIQRGSMTYSLSNFNLNANMWLINKVSAYLENNRFLQFFSNQLTYNLFENVEEFIKDEINNIYINSSSIGIDDNIGALIIDLLCKRMIATSDNTKKGFIIFIDEAHRYLTAGGLNNEIDFNNGLINIAKEGRKKGVFLFLTTQSPKDIPVKLMGQIGTLIIHRLTSLEELNAISGFTNPGIVKQIKKLNRGQAVITSINLLNDIDVTFNPVGNRKHYNDTKIL